MWKDDYENDVAHLFVMPELHLLRTERADAEQPEAETRKWDEERLALLALVLGNVCFAGLFLLWIL
ncbi:MAG: hypothetical protein AB7G75_37130 [Candidatus Binatia bacterium]